MAKTTIYFVSDLHGSSRCFRKFVNAAPIYGANVLILGADLAGKAIQQIERQPGGRWTARFVGREQTVEDGPELAALEKLIADHGYYPYRAEPGELEAMQADGTLDDLFLRLMKERLAQWLTIADERLRPHGVPLYFMLVLQSGFVIFPVIVWVMLALPGVVPGSDAIGRVPGGVVARCSRCS